LPDPDVPGKTTYVIELEIRVRRADGGPLLWPEPLAAVSVAAGVQMPPAASPVDWLLVLQELLGKHALPQLIRRYPPDDNRDSLDVLGDQLR
jgi:hypothetical protein